MDCEGTKKYYLWTKLLNCQLQTCILKNQIIVKVIDFLIAAVFSLEHLEGVGVVALGNIKGYWPHSLPHQSKIPYGRIGGFYS